MITALTATPAGDLLWLLAWASDLAAPVFRIFRDGRLVDTTTLTEALVSAAPGEAPVFEVLDDPLAAPTPAYPPYLLLTWLSVPGCDHYRVEQFVSAAWTARKDVPDDGSATFSWQSPTQPDGLVAQFRVIPVGTNGNDGTPLTFAELVVHVPDPPACAYAYSAGTGTVTITAV